MVDAGAEELKRGDARLSFGWPAHATWRNMLHSFISVWGIIGRVRVGQDIAQDVSPLPLVRRQLMPMPFIPWNLCHGVTAQL
jgi:hypothetical protein